MISTDKSNIEEVFPDFVVRSANRLLVKRDDLIHPDVSGNKWRKLKYNMLSVQQQKLDGIITFGGAYSNHLLATAAACNLEGMKSVGIVRGEELNEHSNSTLQRCSELGMRLVFVSREEYNLRNDELYQKELHEDFQNYLLVPEGGANYLGIIGCQEIWSEIKEEFDFLFVAQGTTTTSVGLAMACPAKTKIFVVPALKGFDSAAEMTQLAKSAFIDHETILDLTATIESLDEYHFGGYGKHTPELLEFMDSFAKETGLLLDQVYTGKVMFAIQSEIKKRAWTNKKILFLHTGGLQGRLPGK